MSTSDSISEPQLATIILRLQELTPVRIWLIAIFISVLMTEFIVSVMELLLKGHVTYDYLLTGFVASSSVAGIVAALIISLLARLKHEVQSNEWMRRDLNESEERYKLAITASNSAMWDYDLTTGRVFLSDNWSKFLCGAEKPAYLHRCPCSSGVGRAASRFSTSSWSTKAAPGSWLRRWLR